MVYLLYNMPLCFIGFLVGVLMAISNLYCIQFNCERTAFAIKKLEATL